MSKLLTVNLDKRIFESAWSIFVNKNTYEFIRMDFYSQNPQDIYDEVCDFVD